MFECRNLHKRFVAGAGRCRASTHVLRGIDLTLHARECVAVVGPHGAGKSTLLRCVAGLLTPEAGDVRWYEHDALTWAGRAVAYCELTPPVDEIGIGGTASIHAVDVTAAGELTGLGAWIASRRGRGSAVLLALRDETIARAVASRVVFLRGGRLQPAARDVARVAERLV